MLGCSYLDKYHKNGEKKYQPVALIFVAILLFQTVLSLTWLICYKIVNSIKLYMHTHTHVHISLTDISM